MERFMATPLRKGRGFAPSFTRSGAAPHWNLCPRVLQWFSGPAPPGLKNTQPESVTEAANAHPFLENTRQHRRGVAARRGGSAGAAAAPVAASAERLRGQRRLAL